MTNRLISELSSSQFLTLIEGERIVLADFFATWCGPCKAMEPVIERLAEQLAPSVEVVKINIDNCPELAQQFGVRGVPSFLVFSNGKLGERAVGIISEKALTSLIEPYLAGAEKKVSA
ncbi:MAG: thioredoxin [Acidobacteriota bacterium]